MIGKGYIYVLISFVLLISTVYAATLEETLVGLCDDIMGLIPSVAFLLIATAAVAYMIGQLMPSDSRARAQVWAMSCLIGAIVGMVMFVVVPSILGALISAGVSGGSSVTIDCTGISHEACGQKIWDMGICT